MDWEDFDYTEHREKLEEDIRQLSLQNSLLGETLSKIMVDIDHLSETSFSSRADQQFDYLRLELRDCIDEVAKDYAEFESDELKRRVDGIFERHSKRVDHLEARLIRIERKNRR